MLSHSNKFVSQYSIEIVSKTICEALNEKLKATTQSKGESKWKAVVESEAGAAVCFYVTVSKEVELAKSYTLVSLERRDGSRRDFMQVYNLFLESVDDIIEYGCIE